MRKPKNIADALEIEVLSGALLAAASMADAKQVTAWRERGVAFFRRDAGGAATGPYLQEPAQGGRPDLSG
jgi:conjugative transfer protein TraD